jgi:hypothetical protein
MSFSYCLYLLTFLGWPIVVMTISKYFDLSKHKILAKYTALIFLIHNALFLSGYSLKGDYIDYVFFSIEYLFFCFVIATYTKPKKTLIKIFRIIGIFFICIGCIQGIIGVILFIPASQDFEADKTYTFQHNGDLYETRRYSFGAATLIDTRYTFETYKTQAFLLERKIDKTDFFGNSSNLNFYDPHFNIRLLKNEGADQLQFSSSNGNIFNKAIE